MELFTLYDLVLNNLSKDENKIALEKGNDSLTYGEFDGQCNKIGGFLHNFGLNKGDRVGIYTTKSLNEIVAMFSISRVGGIFVNLNNKWKIRQLEYAIKDCGIKILFTDSFRINEIIQSNLIDFLDCIILIGNRLEHEKVVMFSDIDNNYDCPIIRTIGSDTAGLFYTSGSSGNPKGVMFSHINIIQGAQIVSNYLKNTESDKVLSVLPFSFDYGFNQITTMFYCHGTLVLLPVFFPAEIVRAINEKNITGLAGVPSIWISLSDYLAESNLQLNSLRYITNSGGTIPKHVLEQMAQLFNETDIYLM